MNRALKLFSASAGGMYFSTNICNQSYSDVIVKTKAKAEVEPNLTRGRFDGMSLMAGTAGKELTLQLKDILDCPVTSCDTKKYVFLTYIIYILLF
mgnify:CR=1 FL=1